MTETVFLTILVLSVVGTVWLRATTEYKVEADRLRIKRTGFTWIEILFRDVEEIEHRSVFLSRLYQIRLYQLGFRQTLRIRRRRGFRYVLINPRDPASIWEAFQKFRAGLRSEFSAQNGGVLPGFLRRSR